MDKLSTLNPLMNKSRMSSPAKNLNGKAKALNVSQESFTSIYNNNSISLKTLSTFKGQIDWANKTNTVSFKSNSLTSKDPLVIDLNNGTPEEQFDIIFKSIKSLLSLDNSTSQSVKLTYENSESTVNLSSLYLNDFLARIDNSQIDKKSYMKLFRKLLDSKNEDGTKRFDIEGILYLLKGINNNNKDVLNAFIDHKSPDGTYSFNNLYNLKPLWNAQPGAVKCLGKVFNLLEAKGPDGNNRIYKNDRNVDYLISHIVEALPEKESFLDYVLEKKFGNDQYRFYNKSILIFKTLDEKNLNLFNKLIKLSDLSTHKDYLKPFQESDSLEEILKIASGKEDIAEIIVDCALEVDQNNQPRLNLSEITKIIQLANTENVHELKAILHSRLADGCYRFNNSPKDNTSLSSIISGCIKYLPQKKEYFDKVFNLKQSNGDFLIKDETMLSFKFLTPENIKYFEKLITVKNNKNEALNWKNLDALETIVNEATKKELYLDKIISNAEFPEYMTMSSGSNIYEFCDYMLASLLKTLPQFETSFNDLLKSRIPNHSGSDFDVFQISKIFNSINNDNILVFNLLYNTKNDDKPVFTNYKTISNILDKTTDKDLKDLQYLLSLNSKSQNFDQQCISSFLDIIKTPVVKKILNGSTLESLNKNDKRQLMQLYRAIESATAFEALKQNKISYPLLPFNDSEKARLIEELSSSLYASYGRKVLPKVKQETLEALNNIESSIKNYNGEPLKLKISRDDFIKRTSQILAGLSPKDAAIVKIYFNISSKDGKLNRIPYLREVDDKSIEALLSKSMHPDATKDALIQVSKTIQDFTFNNEVILTSSVSLEKDLNVIIKAFPEFVTTVDKQETHNETLDTHLLKALKYLTSEPEYKNLSSKDKFVAKIVTLFHDLAKEEGILDPIHQQNTACLVQGMLERFGIEPLEIDRIASLIKNHHWVGELEAGIKSIDDLTFEFRRPNDLDIAVIFTKADLKSGKEEAFLRNLEQNYPAKIDQLRENINQLHSTGIYLPQTRIPKASEIKHSNNSLSFFQKKPSNYQEIDGNVVITLCKNSNFVKLGFDKGTDSSNFRAVIHAIDEENPDIIQDIQISSKEGQNGVLSTSYIDLDNYNTYGNREYGFILNVDPSNISVAFNKNLSSGCEKNLDTFKKLMFVHPDYNYEYGIDKEEPRKMFSNAVKSLIKGETSNNYAELFRELSEYKSLTDIPSSNTRKMIIKALHDSVLNLNNSYNNNKFSEIVVYTPKPAAIFSKDNYENMPQRLKDYARSNDLPIVVLPKE